MIAIVDYGVGNLFSLKCSLDKIGAESIITGDVDIIKKSDKIILPGVGAFEDAIKKLRDTGLDKVIISEADSGKEIMGICLGMQLLFNKSYENGAWKGLGLINGEVKSMEEVLLGKYKIPQIGWNKLIFKKPDCKILKYINDGDYVYFVHSFAAFDCENSLIATTEYGTEFTAIVAQNNIYGCQFHPEKSGNIGLKLLKAFCE